MEVPRSRRPEAVHLHEHREQLRHSRLLDNANAYMLILLNSTWYHYCEIDAKTMAALIGAPAVGRFYNANIRGTGVDGHFDCRTHKMPTY